MASWLYKLFRLVLYRFCAVRGGLRRALILEPAASFSSLTLDRFCGIGFVPQAGLASCLPRLTARPSFLGLTSQGPPPFALPDLSDPRDASACIVPNTRIGGSGTWTMLSDVASCCCVTPVHLGCPAGSWSSLPHRAEGFPGLVPFLGSLWVQPFPSPASAHLFLVVPKTCIGGSGARTTRVEQRVAPPVPRGCVCHLGFVGDRCAFGKAPRPLASVRTPMHLAVCELLLLSVAVLASASRAEGIALLLVGCLRELLSALARGWWHPRMRVLRSGSCLRSFGV